MNVLKILGNLRSILALLRSIEKVGAEIVQGKTWPNCEDADELLSLLEGLLKNGVIDFPGVDENQIADWIETLRGQLTCKK
jgi:hypothetical protein